MKLEGTVETPKTPQQPTGPMWDELHNAKSRSAVVALRDRAHRQGYAAEGQLMVAIADRLAALDRPPKKKARRKQA